MIRPADRPDGTCENGLARDARKGHPQPTSRPSTKHSPATLPPTCSFSSLALAPTPSLSLALSSFQQQTPLHRGCSGGVSPVGVWFW